MNVEVQITPATATLTCPMCGHTYEPGQQTACSACPLQKGCNQLVCCPACGYETVDVSQSGLARLASRLFSRASSLKLR